MTSQPPERPDPPEKSNPISRKRDRLVKTFQERDWSGFLLEILGIIIIVGGPGGLVAQQIIEKAFPELLRGYWIAFIEVVAVLFTLGVVLELCKRRRSTGNSPRPSWKLFSRLKTPLILFLFVVAVFYTWNLIISPLIIPQLNNSLSCDVQRNKDCFSWGETALLSPDVAFNPGSQNDGWKAKCYENQTLKISGTSNYNPKTFEVAKQHFESYIEQCPNDSEARIYLNNVIAELAGNSIIRVAVSAPISKLRDGSFESQEILRGVAFAQYEINKTDGIGGRKLLIGIADDGYEEFDKTVIVSTAKFLADTKSIVGVVGHNSSRAVAATQEVYTKSGLVAISPTSTAVRQDSSDKISETISLGGYVFRTSPNDQFAANLLAGTWANLYGYAGIAIVHNEKELYSKSFKENFTRNLVNDESGKVVNESSEGNQCDISKTLYRNNPILCLKYIEDLPDKAQGLLLIPGPNQEDLTYMQKLIEENNKTSLKLLGSDTMSKIGKLVAPETESLIMVLPWSRTSSSEFKTEFEMNAKNYLGLEDKKNNLTWRTAMAYDATQALAEGIRQASSKSCALQQLVPKFFNDCLRQNLLKALKGELNQPDGFSAVSAVGKNKVSFDEKGDRESVVGDRAAGIGVLVEICKADGEELGLHHFVDCGS